jgi:hypothetical protein
MDVEQRYLLDLQGFLIVKGVLSAEELTAAQQAAGRYADAAFTAGQEGLPGGFGQKGARSSNMWCGVAYDKALEWLCWHPRIWPMILELTDNRPQMNGPGTMIVDDLQHSSVALRSDEPEPDVAWHCAREIGDLEDGSCDADRARAAASCELRDGKLRCNNFVRPPLTSHPLSGGEFEIAGSRSGMLPLPGHGGALRRRTCNSMRLSQDTALAQIPEALPLSEPSVGQITRQMCTSSRRRPHLSRRWRLRNHAGGNSARSAAMADAWKASARARAAFSAPPRHWRVSRYVRPLCTGQRQA